MRFFLSHSESEKRAARILLKKLESQGHEVLTAGSINPREEITRALGKMIEEAEAYVIVVSCKAIGDERLTWEWRTALESSWRDNGKPIYGVLIGDVAPPAFLAGRQLVRVSSSVEIGAAAENLLDRLQGDPLDAEAFEEIKARGKEIVSHVSNEIRKFDLTPEQLEKQRRWLERKIEGLAGLPANADVARLNLKLANVVKSLAERGIQATGTAVSYLQKSLEIMEQLQNVPPEKRAELGTRIAQELEKEKDFDGAFHHAYRALEVCAEELQRRPASLNRCDEKVPALESLIERVKDAVGEDNVRNGLSIVASLMERTVDGGKGGGQQ